MEDDSTSKVDRQSHHLETAHRQPRRIPALTRAFRRRLRAGRMLRLQRPSKEDMSTASQIVQRLQE